MASTPRKGRAPRQEASHLLSRELSWLAFNERVLAEATRRDVPLLERLKFLSIVASNLDEFFMVRVARLESAEAGGGPSPDGMSPKAQLAAISDRAHAQIERQYEELGNVLMPALSRAGIRVSRLGDLDEAQLRHVEDLFARRVFPVLTPLVVDQSHPFPWIANLSVNLAVMVSRPGAGRRLAIVQVPRGIPRLVPLPSKSGAAFLLLEDLMVHRLAALFPGGEIQDWVAFRITRDSELEVDPEGVKDFRKAMESEIRRRKRSGVVRLEAIAGRGDSLVRRVAAKVAAPADSVYRVPGPLDLRVLMGLTEVEGQEAHRYGRFAPSRRANLAEGDLWQELRGGDVLLHHPYESFDPVERLVAEAADDPDVLAIKMTLYRAGGDSAIVESLIRAAEKDKQVAVLVELLARFDEEKNLEWSRRLERAGAHVIYGVVGLKTHAKIALVVRREPAGIRRYVHLGTGNYNARTARLYTDFSLFTADDDMGVDASSFFNLITGFSDPPEFRHFVMSPLHIRDRILRLVAREADRARSGVRAEIVMKVNALVDSRTIEALYDASRAGVDVKLLVRGICCLRPGVKGLSERIQVRSIVDRFLEHSRIYYFRNGGHEEIYLSSADLMPRNLDRRVELMFPVLAAPLRERLRGLLAVWLRDNTRSWTLGSDGTYRELGRKAGEPATRAQELMVDEGRRASGAVVRAGTMGIRPRQRPAVRRDTA